MSIIIYKTRQIIPRIVIGLLLILLLAFSPFIISITGAWITELITNEPCHEGNCFWGVVGWLFFITFPLSAILLIIFIIVIIIDILGLKKVKTFGNNI